jgi:DMSO reductase anchor subunit
MSLTVGIIIITTYIVTNHEQFTEFGLYGWVGVSGLMLSGSIFAWYSKKKATLTNYTVILFTSVTLAAMSWLFNNYLQKPTTTESDAKIIKAYLSKNKSGQRSANYYFLFNERVFLHFINNANGLVFKVNDCVQVKIIEKVYTIDIVKFESCQNQ